MEIEPGAGAKLEQSERQARIGRDGQKTGQKHRRARHLVGLRRPFEKGEQEFRVRFEGGEDGGAKACPITRRGAAGIGGGERRRASTQDEGVQAARKPQRQRILAGIARPVLERAADRGTAFEMIEQEIEEELEQRRGERRAEPPAGLRLAREVLRYPRWVACHAGSLPISPWRGHTVRPRLSRRDACPVSRLAT